MKILELTKDEILKSKIDISDRDLVVGFNEPKLKISLEKNKENKILDSKLSARLPTYFLPAIKIAMDQKKRPMIYIISGLNVAFKYNALDLGDRKKMMINNKLKYIFLKDFVKKFFPETFSLFEFMVSQDILKISDKKIKKLSKELQHNFPNEMIEIKKILAHFIKPNIFNGYGEEKALQEYINNPNYEMLMAIEHAISHIFAFGDYNFDGNYIHNKLGYVSVGGHQEKVFNKMRMLIDLYFKKHSPESFFEKKVIRKDNIAITFDSNLPPAYNASFRKSGKKIEFNEVTYENSRTLDFYDKDIKFKKEMDFMYKNFVSKKDYEKFWKEFKDKYFILKERHMESYRIEDF